MINKDNKTIQQEILSAIESGKVTMRPKWHFVAHTALLVVGTVIVYLLILYLMSFMVFVVREQGPGMRPGPGRVINQVLHSLPWILVALSIGFIALLQSLVKRYHFGYGKPLLYSAIGIIIVVTVGTIIVDATHLHRRLHDRSIDRKLPLKGERLYRRYSRPGPLRPPLRTPLNRADFIPNSI